MADSGSLRNPYDPIVLGSTRDGRTVDYELARATNPHVSLIGASGTGKTHLIKLLISEYHTRRITVVVLDTQGDIVGAGENALRGRVNHIGLYYGGAGGASINPMKIAMDEEHGGAVRAVEDVIDCFRVLKGALGEMQEGELRRLVVGTYRNHGIDINRPDTWNRESPNWPDLYRYACNVLMGSEDGADITFGDVRAREAQLKKELAEQDEDGDDAEETPAKSDKPAKDKNEVKGPPGDHVRVEYREAWDRKRVGSIAKTLRALLDTGLFSGDNINIQRGAINVIDVSKLNQKHRQMLIRVLLDRIFGYAIRFCPPEKLNSKLPHTIVVLDEAKYAAAAGRGMFSPLNRIATEGRKFGLGMVVGVQRAEHLTEDQRLNCAATFVLPVAPEARAGTAKYLGCLPAMLESIEPRAEAVYRFNSLQPKLIRIRSTS